MRATANDTLNRLYRAQPSAKQAIANAAGYAVFNDFGMKILFAGGGTGKGLVVNNRTKKETFMKMVEIQAGLGLGIDKYRLVWVFERAADLDQFVNQGWELGAQATVTAQAGGQGVQGFAGAMSVTPGVWLYQLSDSPTFRAMLIYNALIALYLAYLFMAGHLGGLLLWPGVALHAVVALVLTWTWRKGDE